MLLRQYTVKLKTWVLSKKSSFHKIYMEGCKSFFSSFFFGFNKKEKARNRMEKEKKLSIDFSLISHMTLSAGYCPIMK